MLASKKMRISVRTVLVEVLCIIALTRLTMNGGTFVWVLKGERLMRFLGALLLLLSVFSVNAEIYTCEENGRKTFSQLPCGKDAKTVTLQNGAKKIVLDMENNPNAPEEFCNVVVGGWDMAVASGHVGKTNDTVTIGRIEGYMRDRIANMNELRQKGANPDALHNSCIVFPWQRLHHHQCQ